MKLVFLDETFSKGGYFVMSALIIDENIYESMTIELLKLKEENNIPPKVEIKWNLKDFNSQLKKNGLNSYTLEEHKKIKQQVVSIIKGKSTDDIQLAWCLSPLSFFKNDPWRSYDYAIKDLLFVISQNLRDDVENAIILIDEISDSVENSETRRKIFEDYIHNIKAGGKYPNILMMIPGVNSNISTGHQLNDMCAGLINYYLYRLHDEEETVGVDVIDEIKALSIYFYHTMFNNERITINFGIFVKPERVLYSKQLADMKRITIKGLKEDLEFN